MGVKRLALHLTAPVAPLQATMPSTPKYPIDIPPNLLVHALHELDRDESERIIGAQAGSSAAIAAKASFRTTQQNDSYQSCSYTFTTSTNRSHREDNRWANVYACESCYLLERREAH
jgi:hypothetical protein